MSLLYTRKLQNGDKTTKALFIYKSGGGIHIDQKNKGKFTATKKKTGKTTEELTHSKNPLTRKRAVFAKNARKFKHAEGGSSPKFQTGSKIPVPKQHSTEIKEHYSRVSYTMPTSSRTRKDTTAEIEAQREARIRASVEARKTPWTANNWREKLAAENSAAADKISLQQLPVVGKYVPGVLDITGMIGNMATSLASAPLRAKKTNSILPYLTSASMPLFVGATAGIGAKTTGKFVNNLVNPIAGIQRKNVLKQPIPLLDRVEPVKIHGYLRLPPKPGIVDDAWKKYSIPAAKTELPKSLEPYISRSVRTPSREQEVFENFLSPAGQADELAKRTTHYDSSGNVIQVPEGFGVLQTSTLVYDPKRGLFRKGGVLIRYE